MRSHSSVWIAALLAMGAGEESRRRVDATPPPPPPRAAIGAPGARFEQNAGQWDERVRFLGRGGRGTLVLTDDAMTIGSDGASITMRLAGARAAAPRGEDELPTKSNFFLGNDPSAWRTGVANFARVRASWLPGVDLVWHGGGRGLEYDLLVDAGVDASRIAIEVEGASALRIRGDGALEITTPRSTIVEAQPLVVQDGRTLVARYRLDGPGRIGFDIEGYDQGRPILIDPVVLAYSTYLGGSGLEQGGAIAVDAAGYVYVTGQTQSTNFPTKNAYQSSLAAGSDAFVVKLGTSGAPPVYATYLGGELDDIGGDIAVDASGAAYVTGQTDSSAFPTKNAYQSSNGGGLDAFVAKLAPSGSALVYSTYLGGSGFDDAYAVALDGAGDAFIVGNTNGSTGLATAGAYQTSPGGNVDAFVAKLDATGSKLAYLTYLGGGGAENGNAIAVDNTGAAYVTGETDSTGFPVVSAFQSTLAGTINAYVTKLDPAGAAVVYSTYLGGNGTDYGYGIAVAADGTAYVAGFTSSTNFPTANAFQSAYGGNTDAFVTRVAATGSSLLYSTYLGGSGQDSARPIALDGYGNAYVGGATSSTDFPTLDGLQASNAGGEDAFVTKLDPTGKALVYSTYLGGASNDWAVRIVVDPTGAAYVGGSTESTDFPTVSPAQATNGGGTADDFISKLDPFPDASAPVDAGLPSDASAADASFADAGAGDAASDAASTDGSTAGDGSSGADAGVGTGSGGCGCKTAGGDGEAPRAELLLVAVAAAAAVRRRRRG